MGLGDILGGLGGAVGGLFGGNDETEAARKAYQQALDAFKGLSPDQIDTLLQQSQTGASAFESQDPTAMKAQLDALGHMQDVYRTGGMTMQDRVAQEEATQQANQNDAMRSGALRQEMAARGQGGGGAEIAARLAGAGSAANAAHMAGAHAAADAANRALSAMTGAGALGGQVSGLQNQQSAARDAMARFNASQRSDAYQQRWGETMDKARGVAGAAQGQGSFETDQAAKERAKYAGLGRAVGGAVGAAGDAYATGGASAAAPEVPYMVSSAPNKKNWWET
jgi:hypothetical protein